MNKGYPMEFQVLRQLVLLEAVLDPIYALLLSEIFVHLKD
jgi:hypothetical protein